jgi:glycerol transport system permease protein
MSTRKPYRNHGLLFVLPAVLILMFSFFLPIIAVLNFSVQDVFSGNNFFWAGPRWFEQILGSAVFWQTFGRTVLFSVLAIAIEVPLGLWIALNLP